MEKNTESKYSNMIDDSKTENHYVVATVKPWNISAFNQYVDDLPGSWHLLTSKGELNLEALQKINPRYIFFPHWSWLVPSEILEEFECVCFHMTDVPYGRGGSPLQNLIVLGHENSKLTALKMSDELDAGPVYTKLDFDLNGSALAIYERVSVLCYRLIRHMVYDEPTPVPQEGDIVSFKRRTEEESKLPEHGSLRGIYNHIRMLDAPTYPKSKIEYGNFLLEFSDASLHDEQIFEAKVTISIKKPSQS